MSVLPRTFIGSEFRALSPKAREQLSGKVFNRMANLLRKGVYTFGVRVEGKDYRVSEAESAQFRQMILVVQERFLRQHRGLEVASNMFTVGLGFDNKPDRNLMVLFYMEGIEVKGDTSPEGLLLLPAMYRRIGSCVMVHLFVDSTGDRLVVHLQEIPPAMAGNEHIPGSSSAALDFAAGQGCVVSIGRCTGCSELMPVLKKCLVCNAGFCDRSCMRECWPAHKRVCKPRPKEEVEAEELALAAVAASRQSGCPCGNPTASLRCGRCKQVSYCSKPCQVACWRFHRAVCQRC